MTLYNKDGSVYKLAGPNPVMKEQKLWGDFVTHNMKWTPEVSENNTEINPIDSDFYVRDSFLDALNEAKEEIKVVETKQEEKPVEFHKIVVKEDPENKPSLPDEIEKTFIYCLPAEIRERKDSLYGETYKTVQYGKATSFEAVILNQNDFVFEVWTDTNKIGQGSILYPKTGFKRWWKVQSKIEKAEGWLITATPSDFQPSFENL
jgi:hypothetical protein